MLYCTKLDKTGRAWGRASGLSQAVSAAYLMMQFLASISKFPFCETMKEGSQYEFSLISN